MFIGIVGWVVLGLIIGFVASKFIDLRGDDPRLGIAVACGGAIVGGVLQAVISGSGVLPWNIWSVIFAALGSVIGVIVWHLVRARFATGETFTARRSY